jgi:molybdenum cofactor biosynthesis protein B
MATIPHADAEQRSLNCAVLTISDTRTVADDLSGQLLQQLLQTQGHRIGFYGILPDQPSQIQAQVSRLIAQPDLPVLILTGGTGIAPRDNTYATIVGFFNQELPGFGELFRWLSFQEVGSRAMASRAVAGITSHAAAGPTLVFSLPGSQNAVRLAMEKLILPELGHLTKQLQI